jgi:TonB-linked SusC/RagA family outer membrane protein
MRNGILLTSRGHRILNRFLPPALLVLLSLVITPALAQTIVRGTVKDENGATMPGVNVLLKNTTIGSATDANGAYSISVPDNNAVIVFSFIGYLTTEQTVGDRTTIDISLAPNVKELSEVVVVGYGTQQKSDITGALVSVGSREIREVPVANVQQALQGRAAGVEVQRVGTAPGATAQIRVRGERSILGSNDPLIVLDGIPYEGSLSDINQDEIATINVLKDASATAIYGSRGANGVVLINTKRGTTGENRLTFNTYAGVTSVARKYDLFNAEEYMAMRDASAWPNGYRAEEVEGMALGRETDWQDLMYQNGYITDNNLGVSGGTDKAQYALSGGYYKETTVLPGQDFQRFSVKATIDTQLGERVKIGLNTLNSLSIANGTQFVNQQPNTPGAYGGTMMYNILAGSPLMSPYTSTGEIFQRPAGNLDDAAQNYNPLFLKDNNNDWVDRVRRIRTFNSIFAEVKIVDGLKYRFNLGLDYNQQNYGQFRGQDSYFRPNNQVNQARVRNAENYSWTAENIVNYEKTFADAHRLNVTGLFSAQQSSGWFTQVTKEAVTADFIEFYNMGLADPAGQTVLDGGEETWGILSYMARANYAYKDKYLLTATYRRDGSSRLAEKWHQYPAFALGWNITNESFMAPVSVLSTLKLRVGYGQTSNQAVAPYTTLGGVTNSNGGVPIKYNYGPNTLVSGFIPNRIPDKTLDWEYTNTVNVGLDFGLFGDRVTGSIEWYKAKTDNLLYNVQMPITSGYQDAFQTNVGSMENKGLEIALSGTVLKSPGGFTWTADVNWFYNRNKIVSLNEGVDRVIGSGLFVGYPTTAIFDYTKLGIWQLGEESAATAWGQAPGQLKFADVGGPNGGPPDNLLTEDDRSVIGDQQADWQGGMTNRFTYKGFDLSFVIYARMGGTLISYLHAPNGAYLTNLNGQRNGLDVDYWTPTNATNWFPAPSSPLPGGAANGWSTLGYYDASFVKVRSINFGYTLPATWVDKINAQSVRLYVTAQNPFLLYCPYVTKYNGVDPEPTGQGATGTVATGGNIRTNGPNQNLIISASTPPTRSYIIGLNLTF